MFNGSRASSYETVARKFRPSVAFDWKYFPETATISTTEAQQWCVEGLRWRVWKLQPLVESLISPKGQCEVSSPGRHYRANPEGVKERPFKCFRPACDQQRYAYGEASGTVLWYLFRNCKLPLVQIQVKHDHLVEFWRGPRHLSHTLTTTHCRTSDDHVRWSHARRTLRLPRTCCGEKPWKFWIGQAEVLIWIWSQTCCASSNDNQTITTPSSAMRRIYALRFTGCGMVSLEHQPAT